MENPARLRASNRATGMVRGGESPCVTEESAPAVLIVADLHGEQMSTKHDSQVTCCTMAACHRRRVTLVHGLSPSLGHDEGQFWLVGRS